MSPLCLACKEGGSKRKRKEEAPSDQSARAQENASPETRRSDDKDVGVMASRSQKRVDRKHEVCLCVRERETSSSFQATACIPHCTPSPTTLKQTVRHESPRDRDPRKRCRWWFTRRSFSLQTQPFTRFYISSPHDHPSTRIASSRSHFLFFFFPLLPSFLLVC